MADYDLEVFSHAKEWTQLFVYMATLTFPDESYIKKKKQTKISTTTNPPEEMQDYTPPSACMSFILQFFFFHSSQQQYLNPKWEVKPPYKKLWNKTFLLWNRKTAGGNVTLWHKVLAQINFFLGGTILTTPLNVQKSKQTERQPLS